MREPKKIYIEQGIVRGTSAVETKTILHDYEYISIEYLKKWARIDDRKYLLIKK